MNLGTTPQIPSYNLKHIALIVHGCSSNKNKISRSISSDRLQFQNKAQSTLRKSGTIAKNQFKSEKLSNETLY